jgi:ectoine hydroxylase-related dioxygenase (phytanoyl-CoA dioxygenase family)
MILSTIDAADVLVSGPEAARRAFLDAGYVVITNAIESSLVDELRSVYLGLLDDFLRVAREHGVVDQVSQAPDRLALFTPIAPPFDDPEVVANPAAVVVLEALLGADLTCTYLTSNTPLPGAGVQPIHRDHEPLFMGECDAVLPAHVVSVGIPLVDMSDENGTTELWPGTHRLVDGDRLESRVAALPSLRPEIAAGSLLMRDTRMWHRGTANQGDAARPMLSIVYTRGWLLSKPLAVPDDTWARWGQRAHHLFRFSQRFRVAGEEPAAPECALRVEP